MLLLLFLYLAYIALAGNESENSGSDRITAIFGLVGAVNIPIIHYSVVWWNTLHQPPSLSMQGSAIAFPILWPLIWTGLGFLLLFKGIVLMRMRMLIAENRKVARLRRMARA